jgi:hypothetical protein
MLLLYENYRAQISFALINLEGRFTDVSKQSFYPLSFMIYFTKTLNAAFSLYECYQPCLRFIQFNSF